MAFLCVRQMHYNNQSTDCSQVVQEGYEFFGDRRLVTIFSAPNYCNEFSNCAAIMMVSADLTCSFRVIKPQDLGSQFSET